MEQLTGYEQLKASVEKDCKDGCGCFNPDGCNVKGQAKDGKFCLHAYCDKFKWVTDRANHYAEKLDLDSTNILDAWESRRNYWYMNFYQESNQPTIVGDRVRVFETVNEMLEKIGEKRFRCPACGGISASPYTCNSEIVEKGKTCDWKVYGLFGDLGKGVFVYCKDKLEGETIFMPIAWEEAVHE